MLMVHTTLEAEIFACFEVLTAGKQQAKPAGIKQYRGYLARVEVTLHKIRPMRHACLVPPVQHTRWIVDDDGSKDAIRLHQVAAE